ncbi:MAG: MqnA/MqnD/SBP family protein, partial [Rikenellaceae bacterium]
MKTLSLSISPCPNDTFMFDAIVNSKINLRGYKFDCVFEDIDTLNCNIKNRLVDISKISYAAYPKVSDSYNILSSGSALGRGNAPLLVSRMNIYPDEVACCRVAIPGYETTAALLLKYAFGQVKELKQYLFSDVAEAVLTGETDAGVLIHEERFVYKQKSLRLVADLSDMWNAKINLPIPLGAIVVNKQLDAHVQQ